MTSKLLIQGKYLCSLWVFFCFSLSQINLDGPVYWLITDILILTKEEMYLRPFTRSSVIFTQFVHQREQVYFSAEKCLPQYIYFITIFQKTYLCMCYGPAKELISADTPLAGVLNSQIFIGIGITYSLRTYSSQDKRC